MAQLEGTPPDQRESFEEFIDWLKKGADIKIVDEKVSGRAAVVLGYDNPRAGKKIDIDPFYLIKQGDEWKVMPDFTDWDLAASSAKDAVADFEKVEKWYRTRKAEIYAELEK